MLIPLTGYPRAVGSPITSWFSSVCDEYFERVVKLGKDCTRADIATIASLTTTSETAKMYLNQADRDQVCQYSADPFADFVENSCEILDRLCTPVISCPTPGRKTFFANYLAPHFSNNSFCRPTCTY